jgi:threonyl-tRNA synthetase
MIHRALFGTIERFFAILTEHYAGAFPAWLAPVQATIVPVADRHEDYAAEIAATLKADGRRVEILPAHTDSIGARIRRAKLDKVPYVLVVGDDDVKDRTVGGSDGDERGVALADFVARLAADVDSHVHA